MQHKIEIEILKILLKSSHGLEAFTIFKRLKISFSSFIKNMASLTNKGMIEEAKEEFYKITSIGISQLNLAKKNNSTYAWLVLPERFEPEKFDVNSFYIPNRRLLDKITFKIE
ncbi:hypothetical protein ACV6DN_04595 [Enterobacter asburiae]|jgi:predicted transcriptional regulator|uniref:hypothetical protein n=1 Tax=Enterobacteriaceae TaxID=543 RepID=UPI002175A83F|nr:hypothetical protein [Enterobacter asburiae]MCS5455893.1 hypothetical protein [Enterobacter asburiae]